MRLSVNVNKIATLRNSRGGALPRVVDAVRVCLDAGAPGITVHPRADARHITALDVHGDRRVARRRGGADDRVQHRGRSAAGSARDGARGAPASVHAGAGPPGRGHEPGRMAGRHARGRARRRSSSDLQERRHPRQPVRRSRSGGGPVGGVARRRIASSSTRSRSRTPSRKARMPRTGSFRRYVEAANLAHALGLGDQRRARSRSRQPGAFPDAAASRRGVDRPRADQPCALRRAGPGGPGLSAGL